MAKIRPLVQVRGNVPRRTPTELILATNPGSGGHDLRTVVQHVEELRGDEFLALVAVHAEFLAVRPDVLQ